MKKGIWIPIVVLIALGGGVAMAFALNGSDDIALTDDFTSSFLDPEVETDEGFHYFQSEKNNFSMWFPAGYYIEDDPVRYESKDHFEFLNIHEDQSHSNEKEYWGFIQLKYRGNMIEHDAEIQLQILLNALVQSPDLKEFMVVDYELYCKEEETCTINDEQESRFFNTLIQSIRFQK
ncbi:hypothetical protein [Shouchella clausii]|uniref:hypothetical protein n=1 Tax=Shouchella clausii TaxID=79880 RepID=UPI0032EBD1A0